MIYIGTSGWTYPHWKDNFYGRELQTKKWLNFYAKTFSTVEVNSTFYGLPTLKTTQNWQLQVPDDFRFAIKASRYLTHQKRLHDCQDGLKRFFDRLVPLRQKSGPILFQLPPSFEINQE